MVINDSMITALNFWETFTQPSNLWMNKCVIDWWVVNITDSGGGSSEEEEEEKNQFVCYIFQ